MNATKISLVAIALAFAVCFVAEGKRKSDIIVMGGEEGCGPQLFLKTGGKRKENDILVMNPCKKKKEIKYIPIPIYENHEYDNHGYDSGYGMGGGGHHGGGMDMGSQGYDHGGY